MTNYERLKNTENLFEMAEMLSFFIAENYRALRRIDGCFNTPLLVNWLKQESMSDDEYEQIKIFDKQVNEKLAEAAKKLAQMLAEKMNGECKYD